MKDASAEYIAKEEATQRQPAELYHFWVDGDEHWRYTDGDIAITFDGDTYSPATLSRSLTKYDVQLEVTSLKIDAAFVEQPILEYIAVNPVELIWISIMKLFRDQDPLEANVIFIGQIKDVSFKGDAAQVTCVGFEHFLKKTVPRWRYQETCNHMLFDSQCTKVEADYKVVATVTLDVTGVELSSATFAAQVDGYFTGGKVVFGEEKRTIVAHIGSMVTLMYKMSELEDGNSVDAYPGCDGRIETCRDKYDNLLNFLGFPFIPIENPALRVSW